MLELGRLSAPQRSGPEQLGVLDSTCTVHTALQASQQLSQTVAAAAAASPSGTKMTCCSFVLIQCEPPRLT